MRPNQRSHLWDGSGVVARRVSAECSCHNRSRRFPVRMENPMSADSPPPAGRCVAPVCRRGGHALQAAMDAWVGARLSQPGASMSHEAYTSVVRRSPPPTSLRSAAILRPTLAMSAAAEPQTTAIQSRADQRSRVTASQVDEILTLRMHRLNCLRTRGHQRDRFPLQDRVSVERLAAVSDYAPSRPPFQLPAEPPHTAINRGNRSEIAILAMCSKHARIVK